MRGFVLGREKEIEQMIEEEGQLDNTKKKKLRWCRFEYEHMPDFCYTCEIIGHRDKECKMRPAKDEAPQFGPWMRAEDESNKSVEGARGKWMGSRSSEDSMGAMGYKQDGMDRRPYHLGREGSGMGSATLSWRKDGTASRSSGRSSKEEEREVTSPLKSVGRDDGVGSKGTSRHLSFNDKEEEGRSKEDEGKNIAMVSLGEERLSMENMPQVTENDRREKENNEEKRVEEGRGKINQDKAGGKSGRKFKRRIRDPRKEHQEQIGSMMGKRAGEEMKIDEKQDQKKGRLVGAVEEEAMNHKNLFKAGLPEQFCNHQ
uniref:Zinc knuckle CX2CX4HX4C domain-containing protein n=1 Tax=Hordeum vulgare subsp. vulgare TaxID=112509 RepID=A0A8I6XXZ6_HORVV